MTKGKKSEKQEKKKKKNEPNKKNKKKKERKKSKQTKINPQHNNIYSARSGAEILYFPPKNSLEREITLVKLIHFNQNTRKYI